MAESVIWGYLVQIFRAFLAFFTGWILSLLVKSKQQNEHQPPILPLTVPRRDVLNSNNCKVIIQPSERAKATGSGGYRWDEVIFSQNHATSESTIQVPEDISRKEVSVRDWSSSQSSIVEAYAPPRLTQSSKLLPKSSITSLHTTFATPSEQDSSASFLLPRTSSNASALHPPRKNHSGIKGDTGASSSGSTTNSDVTGALHNRSPLIREIVLDLKRTSEANFKPSVFLNRGDEDSLSTRTDDSSPEDAVDSISGLGPFSKFSGSLEAGDNLTPSSSLYSTSKPDPRDIIIDFSNLPTYPYSPLSASSTCAFYDAPSSSSTLQVECIPLPIAHLSNRFSAETLSKPSNGTQRDLATKSKGRISLTSYPDAFDVGMYGRPNSAVPPGLRAAVDSETPSEMVLSSPIKIFEQLHCTPLVANNVSRIGEGGGIPSENPVLVSLEDVEKATSVRNPTKRHPKSTAPSNAIRDPTTIIDRSPAPNESGFFSEPKGAPLTVMRGNGRLIPTKNSETESKKIETLDRDRYRGAAYSRVLPAPTSPSASPSSSSAALHTIPPRTTPIPTAHAINGVSPISPITSPLLAGSPNLNFKPKTIRVVHDMTFGNPFALTQEIKNVRMKDNNNKARRRRSVLKSSTSNPNSNTNVLSGLHGKSRSMSKSTGCEVKASTSSPVGLTG